jgi:ABC-type glycerol-3-phosphate transport system substrate-binding protein
MVEQIGSGICQDITQRINEDGFKDTFYPGAVQNFSFEGKYYGWPNDVAPEVLFYNKELCQKAGFDLGRHALDPNALRTDFRVV